ncbi:MAG: N-acetyltransferase [Alphaproteobacteria bacterium]|nr:N-acetyltransferase [Alphaproteobacteria bacterium]
MSGGPAVTAVPRLAAVGAAEWDACAGAANPFLAHAFLQALEESGSVSAEAGWQPQHVLVRSGDGRLLACAPAYLKSHSYGEYVFDHGWAEAWQRAGGRYYPKLQLSVPFTPATGPRLLVRADLLPDDPTPDALRSLLIDAVEAICGRFDLSSAHATFLEEADRAAFERRGWLLRQGQQFHWENRGYATFDDFLGSLASRKRKMIRKERAQALASGIRLHLLSGADLKPVHWDAFYAFYTDTSDRKWGVPYLTRGFFELIGERYADRVVLVMAEKDGDWVAGALNFQGSDTLYGRNWGCRGEYKFLHFEACYYAAIDHAIARGLKRVEAGAQGTHKIQRGYLPVATWSAHHIPDPGFRRAVADFVEREKRAVAREMAALAEYAPFRQGEAEA